MTTAKYGSVQELLEAEMPEALGWCKEQPLHGFEVGKLTTKELRWWLIGQAVAKVAGTPAPDILEKAVRIVLAAKKNHQLKIPKKGA